MQVGNIPNVGTLGSFYFKLHLALIVSQYLFRRNEHCKPQNSCNNRQQCANQDCTSEESIYTCQTCRQRYCDGNEVQRHNIERHDSFPRCFGPFSSIRQFLNRHGGRCMQSVHFGFAGNIGIVFAKSMRECYNLT